MSDKQLDALLVARGARLDAERARQAAALKLAKRGPWAPAVTIAKPRPRKPRGIVTQIRKRA